MRFSPDIPGIPDGLNSLNNLGVNLWLTMEQTTDARLWTTYDIVCG